MLYSERKKDDLKCDNEDIVIGAESLWFNSQAGQIGQCRQRLASVATFLRTSVAQVLSRGDGSVTRNALRRDAVITKDMIRFLKCITETVSQ